MPKYDAYCTTPECSENTGHYPDSHRVIEVECRITDEPVCPVCKLRVKKIFSAVPGYVKYTANPTKCK